MPAVERLKATYRDWLKACPDDAFESAEPLKPLVFVDVNFEDFTHWIEKPKAHWQFPDIEIFASEVCHQQAVSIMKAAMDKERSQIVPPAYVHLIINEIGNDKANDVGSVYYVSETPGFERRQALVENAKLFFEYGTAVAAAYAIKLKVSAVLFTKQRNR